MVILHFTKIHSRTPRIRRRPRHEVPAISHHRHLTRSRREYRPRHRAGSRAPIRRARATAAGARQPRAVPPLRTPPECWPCTPQQSRRVRGTRLAKLTRLAATAVTTQAVKVRVLSRTLARHFMPSHGCAVSRTHFHLMSMDLSPFKSKAHFHTLSRQDNRRFDDLTMQITAL